MDYVMDIMTLEIALELVAEGNQECISCGGTATGVCHFVPGESHRLRLPANCEFFCPVCSNCGEDDVAKEILGYYSNIN